MPLNSDRCDVSRTVSRPRYEVDENGCWLWLGTLDGKGYGMTVGRGERKAHRAAYRDAYGTIPVGFHVHHRCEVKRCVNPAHLEALSPTDHLRGHWVDRVELTDEVREQIREMARDPQVRQQDIADWFGIPRPTVNKIMQGYSWFDGETVEVERPRCRNCDEPIEGGRRHKKFCDRSCRGKFNSRARYRRLHPAALVQMQNPEEG